MKQNLIALLCGAIFGLGLGVSQMIDSTRVLGFLDVAGTWDPTLIFVLGGAVGVTVIAFRFVLRQATPLFATRFSLPSKEQIHPRLLIGAGIFGVGWGLSGYCPGPGISSLALLNSWNPLLFVAAMAVGSWLCKVYGERFAGSFARSTEVLTTSRSTEVLTTSD